jgi:helicase
MVEVDGRDVMATKFGNRVSELYIDPMSAVILRDGLYSRAVNLTDFSYLHLISRTPDVMPRPRPRGSEMERLSVMAEQRKNEIMGNVPDQFEDPIAYDEFLSEIKSTMVLLDWINEETEDHILENQKVEPGDLLRLVQGSEWMIFAGQELARLFGHKDLLAPLEMLRVRVAKGVKAELVKLVSMEGVGRVRARMLYNAGLRTIEDIKLRSLTELTAIPTIGPSLAKKIKEQAGGLIKADEWERAKQGKPVTTEQAILTEYEETP